MTFRSVFSSGEDLCSAHRIACLRHLHSQGSELNFCEFITKALFQPECPFWRVSFNVGSTCWQTLRFTTTFALSTSCATWLVQDLCMRFLLLLWPICRRHIDAFWYLYLLKSLQSLQWICTGDTSCEEKKEARVKVMWTRCNPIHHYSDWDEYALGRLDSCSQGEGKKTIISLRRAGARNNRGVGKIGGMIGANLFCDF